MCEFAEGIELLALCDTVQAGGTEARRRFASQHLATSKDTRSSILLELQFPSMNITQAVKWSRGRPSLTGVCKHSTLNCLFGCHPSSLAGWTVTTLSCPVPGLPEHIAVTLSSPFTVMYTPQVPGRRCWQSPSQQSLGSPCSHAQAQTSTTSTQVGA